jgi:hypothetical protein
LQGDGEPAPQLGGVPLPDHVRGVVVAIQAQRGTQGLVVVVVPFAAPGRAAMDTDGLVTAGAAGAFVADPVHGPERGRGERRERARMIAHGGGDALAAGQATQQQVPGIGLVLRGTGRAGLDAPVAALEVGDAIQLVRGRVVVPDLPGGRVHHRLLADQPDRSGAATGPPFHGLDTDPPQDLPGRASRPSRPVAGGGGGGGGPGRGGGGRHGVRPSRRAATPARAPSAPSRALSRVPSGPVRRARRVGRGTRRPGSRR